MTATKTVRGILLPPEQWIHERESFVQGTAPDPFEIYSEMRHHGVDIELLDPSDIAVKTLGRFDPMYSGLDPIRAARLLTAYRDVDFILSVFESSGAIPLLLRWLVRYKPKIMTWDLIPDEAWRPRKFIQRLTLGRYDQSFVLSEFHNEYLQQKFGRKGVFVGQHIDTDFYKPVGHVKEGPLLAIGEDSGRDYNSLIAAVADLDVDVVFKTKRSLNLPAKCRARFKQISHRLSAVEFRDLYATASIVVIPLHMTLNASGVGGLLEAGAMGKPTVVSDNPPIRDYYRAGETACVVPRNDVGKLRDAIFDLKSDTAKCEKMGIAARAMVEENYSNRKFAARMAKEIRQSIEV